MDLTNLSDGELMKLKHDVQREEYARTRGSATFLEDGLAAMLRILPTEAVVSVDLHNSDE